ncbi:arabinosyltransferase domain-containing protein [Gordonia sp. HY285]|uniref:arabinosyltransferase domain-containing protein n=1 Tax=Gordonia liuliyuniae TaxID=2911517 RepID=UPI001F003E3B|nr:arabinosyltransferase domain-containing protein [Gordonia liuliyuniae]MCF8609305.1 arabinosyltransferase domain-containing protein [Gordonia liuliyuniae]
MPTPTTARARTYAIIAAVAGTIAIAAAVATPFLPVTQHDAAIDWPTGQQLDPANGSIVAPLATQTPAGLDVTIGRDTLMQDESTTIVSTMPSSAEGFRDNALAITASPRGASVVVRGVEVASATRGELADVDRLHVWTDGPTVFAQFVGLGPAATDEDAQKPLVAGVFTGLDAAQVGAAQQSGLAVHVDVDNRFDLTPTILKWLALVVGVIAAAIALFAAYRLDVLGGYRHRFAPKGRWRLLIPRTADILVTAALVVWHFLGAGSSDDGYILTMGRNADDAGFLGSYYRWFNVPEAPFDWYYSFLGHWAEISTATVWMRLPALVAGLVSWFILSRVLLPRLGVALRRSHLAVLTAAAVFVAFWMPFASGLRSETVIILGSLLTWWMVERTVATRQLLPAALAALFAGLTMAVAPHGIIALAVLIAGSRPMLRAVRARRRDVGLVALVAPVGAAFALVVLIVFRQQTIATVAEAIRVRYTVGPTATWYQELLRYYFLTLSHDDGALARRLPVLILVLALLATLAVLLRRKHIPGIARGPVWRLVGATLLTVLLLSFTPTKWTVQFGVFTGLGSALAAVVVVVMAQQARRSARDFWIYLAALMLACAGATAGANAWGWGFDLGISWSDKIPSLAGQPLPTIILVLTGICFLAAIWCHVRPPRPVAERSGWRAAMRSAPMLIIVVALLLAEFALFARAAVVRSDTYTHLSADLRSLTGDTCGMADDVLVEPDSNAGMLTPIGTDSASKALAGDERGFSPDGVADDLVPENIGIGAGTIHTGRKVSRSFSVTLGTPGTTGGRGPTTVNGSTAALPFGLNPATTPVLGSYGYDDGTATLTSSWYRLPARDVSPLLVISAAGSIHSIDEDDASRPGRSLIVEFGRAGAGNEFQTISQVIPIDPDWGANRPWRNLRIPMADVPKDATAMRIVADDSNVNPDEWLAITPPRAPRLKTLDTVVGHEQPVLLDLSVGAQFPCQQPMTAHRGVFDVPAWQIAPDQITAGSKSKSWQHISGGGIEGVVDAATAPSTASTYLENDWHQDWGALIKLTPLMPDAPQAHVSTDTSTGWGWHRTGPIRAVEPSE